MKKKSKIAEQRKLCRAAKRNMAIASGNLSAYRMAGKTVTPAKGKGVPYKRNKKYN